MKIDEKLKRVELIFIGKDDWSAFRNILILKMQECQTEKDFIFLLKALLGSCFTSANGIDEARKLLNLPLLSKEEREKVEKFQNSDLLEVRKIINEMTISIHKDYKTGKQEDLIDKKELNQKINKLIKCQKKQE